jgi:uncharacterized protein YlzI (FlbEa/FlbD family)
VKALIRLTKQDGYDLLVNFDYLQSFTEGSLSQKNSGAASEVVLADGSRYLVRESVETIIERFRKAVSNV